MGFFDNFFKKKSSGEVAKDRLKLLLVSDRSNCSPETMELIKNLGYNSVMFDTKDWEDFRERYKLSLIHI